MQGRQEGREEVQCKMVKQAKKSGMTVSEIAVMFDMTGDEVERIFNS